MYHYMESGLTNVFLEDGYNISYQSGEQFVSIDNLFGLHRAISTYICQQHSWMSGDQFKFLRKELDLSQTEMGNFLFCDEQDVEGWEKGESPIPRSQDIIMRNIYLEWIGQDSNVLLMIKALQNSTSQTEIAQLTLRKTDFGNWICCD